MNLELFKLLYKMALKKKKKEDKGVSLDDAFADDDDDVEYAETKPRKLEKKEAVVEVDNSEKQEIVVKSSKPIAQIKKGDKIKIDSLILEVDANIVLIDHGSTKEMAIECFDPKNDKDYQIRYFSSQVEGSIEVYELQEILYNKINVKKIEW